MFCYPVINSISLLSNMNDIIEVTTDTPMTDLDTPPNVFLPPLNNFTFGSKEPQYEKDPSVPARYYKPPNTIIPFF